MSLSPLTIQAAAEPLNPNKISILAPKIEHRFRVGFLEPQTAVDIDAGITEPRVAADHLIPLVYQILAVDQGVDNFDDFIEANYIGIEFQDDLKSQARQAVIEQVKRQKLNEDYALDIVVEILDGCDGILERTIYKHAKFIAMTYGELRYGPSNSQNLNGTIKRDDFYVIDQKTLDKVVLPATVNLKLSRANNALNHVLSISFEDKETLFAGV